MRWLICRFTRLLEIGYADMRQNQQHFAEVAKELEPDKTPREVLEELGSKHPAPDQLISTFTATFTSLLALHPLPPHRHYPLGCAARRGRNAAIHARYHTGQHGLARPL